MAPVLYSVDIFLVSTWLHSGHTSLEPFFVIAVLHLEQSAFMTPSSGSAVSRRMFPRSLILAFTMSNNPNSREISLTYAFLMLDTWITADPTSGIARSTTPLTPAIVTSTSESRSPVTCPITTSPRWRTGGVLVLGITEMVRSLVLVLTVPVTSLTLNSNPHSHVLIVPAVPTALAVPGYLLLQRH